MASIIHKTLKATKKDSTRDSMLKAIELGDNQYNDAEVTALVAFLIAQPNVCMHVVLHGNQLTNKTGIKLAKYVAASSTIRTLILCNNQFGQATYLALAAALRVNTSLQYLDLHGNQPEDKSSIDAAFIDALRVNPSCASRKSWFLCGIRNDFPRLQNEAKELGHPSLQLLLCARLGHFTFQIKKH